eukprot:TRINITY_DN10851_c0_g1_i1.p1 TRINITY_DN10851_c0_g1~~TRINITY_DN10851_c0_g1_i1.p1  ORF type:complete len:357 (+),score=63.16 TRINITY_DN10851_c0_g1_i1:36-1106(+)
MLLVDKHRPKTLLDCDYHQKLCKRLETLAKSDDFPHLCLYGPSGAGKKTRILGLLHALFGDSVEKVKTEQRTFEIPNRSITVDVATVFSNHHIELNPSDCGNQDKFVVQEIIKEIAQSQPLETEESRPFKVVVLNEVDHLSHEAQAGLRRTMEKYMRTCRMIMCCTSITKLIPALRSRCLCIRVAAPTVPEIKKVLEVIVAKEKLTVGPKFAQFATLIAKKSNRNLRRAILMLETCKLEQFPFQDNQKIPIPDWEIFIQGVAMQMIAEQSPKRLLAVRGKLYELLVHCIPPEVIMKKLAMVLIENVDNNLKYEVTKWAAFYEHRINEGSKAIFHMEAFVAKFMAIYKEFLITHKMV